MHECYAMQILENKKRTKPKNHGHKGQSNEAQGPRRPRQIKDKKLHQLLDEVSQTYFYQEVW